MTDRERFTAYITKYAITEGIRAVLVERCDGFGRMVKEAATKGCCPIYYHAGEWHRTHEEAAAKAENMRQRRIASVKKQLKKLEDMRF